MFKPLVTRLGAGRALIGALLPPLPMPDSVMVRGQPRPLRVRVHARSRRMILRFDARTGQGRLTVPPGTPASAALTFLSRSARWIDDHAPAITLPGQALHPPLLMLGGVAHAIIPTGRIRGVVARLPGQGLPEHQVPELHVPGAPHRIMARLKLFLQAEAERVLAPQVLELAEKLGKKPSAIRFRDPRSQWGSCSSGLVVTLSWRVMMAPPDAQRYLVAHEVAHLLHMNHAPRFWRTVASLDANWREGQRVLKRHEKELMAIGFD